MIKIGFVLIVLFYVNILDATESYYKNGKIIEVEKLHSNRSSNNSNINYYKTSTGNKIGVKKELIIECKETSTCPTFLESHNLMNYSNLSDTIYIVKIENGENIFNISKILYETGKVNFVHPNFIKTRRKR